MICYLATPEFLGIPWNITRKSWVTWHWIKWQPQSSMEFHGTKWYFIWRHQSSMKFHGIFHGIPWNTCVIWNGALLIPWNPVELGVFYLVTPEFHEIPWNIPCKSRVTWYWLKWHSQSSMEFHGTEWYLIWRHQCSMEFHGIRWNLVIAHLAALKFHGIPWNFVSLNVPWNFRSFMEFHGTSNLGTGIPSNSMELHGIWLYSQIPWNF